MSSDLHTSLTLQQALNLFTIDYLKQLIALLPDKTQPKRKAEFVTAIEQHLQADLLKHTWGKLDDLQQLAVAEAIYSPGGRFDAARFRAKHGQLPAFNIESQSSRFKYQEPPSHLRLFIYSQSSYGSSPSVVPSDLVERLKAFVNKPADITITSTENLPDHIELRKDSYEWQEDDQGVTLIMGKQAYQIPRKEPKRHTAFEKIPLIRRDTEREVLHDLPMLLRWVDRGKAAVSNKTFQPSLATIKALADLLQHGDFYALSVKKDKQSWEQEIGAIKAFAWPLLLQAGKLAQVSGTKLTLTPAGRKALNKPVSEILRQLWQRWLKTTLLDEFNRINVIKGQQGKGKRLMTAVAGRRAVINDVLKTCPTNHWISIDELWRFMQATDFQFDITRDPWRLYITSPDHGSLGYDGFHNWSIMQGRYVLCLLFEYAATLGIIDVAYINPQGARKDFRHMWGIDDLDFLSRYDGLQFIRINALGAYCLQLTDDYTAPIVQTKTAIEILPSLQINITDGVLSADESLLLDNYADQKSDTVWRLSKKKALLAVEDGHDIAELRKFLEARDDQLLPEPVDAFITTVHRQGRALTYQGSAILIECIDKKLADLIATNSNTKALCQRVGKRQLVVTTVHETKFRKAIRSLGYGMPKG